MRSHHDKERKEELTVDDKFFRPIEGGTEFIPPEERLTEMELQFYYQGRLEWEGKLLKEAESRYDQRVVLKAYLADPKLHWSDANEIIQRKALIKETANKLITIKDKLREV